MEKKTLVYVLECSEPLNRLALISLEIKQFRAIWRCLWSHDQLREQETTVHIVYKN